MDFTKKKGQAGLDFLMTYGWALLVIVLVVAALFALGVFDIGSFLGSRTSGFSQIGIVGWNLDSAGTLTVMFENHAGKTVTLTNVTAVYQGQNLAYNTPVTLANGKRSNTLTVGTYPSVDPVGSTYNVEMQINYDDPDTSFSYTDSGTITGKIQ